MTYREHLATDPDPAPGTVLEVGQLPDPTRGRSGDLLTFIALGQGRFIQQHNRSPRGVVVDSATVRFWAPLRVINLQGYRFPGDQSSPPRPAQPTRVEFALAGGERR